MLAAQALPAHLVWLSLALSFFFYSLACAYVAYMFGCIRANAANNLPLLIVHTVARRRVAEFGP